MNNSPETATPFETNIKMVSIALWLSITGLILLVILMPVSLILEESFSADSPLVGAFMIFGWMGIILSLMVSIPMSIAGVIASSCRLKALAAFLISCITAFSFGAILFISTSI